MSRRPLLKQTGAAASSSATVAGHSAHVGVEEASWELALQRYKGAKHIGSMAQVGVSVHVT